MTRQERTAHRRRAGLWTAGALAFAVAGASACSAGNTQAAAATTAQHKASGAASAHAATGANTASHAQLDSRTAAAVSGQAIADLANSQVGNDCSPYTDVHGRSACADWWCAVFAGWVWRHAGVPDAPDTWVGADTAVWGKQHGLFKPRPASGVGDPHPGDLVVFGDHGTGGHVGIVYSVNGNGTITTINGDYGGNTPRQSHVRKETINPVTAVSGAHNRPISGYVSPPSSGGSNPTPPPAKPGKHWVNTFAAATGHSGTSEGTPAQGVLNKGRNYVLCRKWGDDKQVGGAYNHWWLLTDLDRVDRGGSGRAWVSAYYLSHWGNDQAKDVDGNDIPNC